MSTLRRFLVFQALLLWQGGFLFYAAFVVPTGTDVLGTFEQGRVTRHVTDSMNVIGVVALAILAWDQCFSGFRRLRWSLWVAMAGTVAALAWLHVLIESFVDFSLAGKIRDYPTFYSWHRAYLYVAAAQWVFGLAYVAVLIRDWDRSRSSK
jgi:hypothetical protein